MGKGNGIKKATINGVKKAKLGVGGQAGIGAWHWIFRDVKTLQKNIHLSNIPGRV